jgi:hypothetical protein
MKYKYNIKVHDRICFEKYTEISEGMATGKKGGLGFRKSTIGN